MPSVERSGRAASNPRAPYLWLFDTKAPATFTPPGLTRRLGPQPGDMTSFGCRHSLLGHPIPAGELGLPHGRLTGQDQPPGPRRGYRVPHARAATGVGAPYNPRTSGAHPAGSPPRPAPAASQRPVPKPRHDIPPREALLHGPSTGVQSRSPVRSSPRPRPRDGTSGASASPRASHPAVTGSARQGQGQAIEHGPGTTAQLTSVDLQSGSSLNACDLASHGEEEGRNARWFGRLGSRAAGAVVAPWRVAVPARVSAFGRSRCRSCSPRAR